MNALTIRLPTAGVPSQGPPGEADELALLLEALRRLLLTSTASERELDLAVLAHAVGELYRRRGADRPPA